MAWSTLECSGRVHLAIWDPSVGTPELIPEEFITWIQFPTVPEAEAYADAHEADIVELMRASHRDRIARSN